MVSALSGCQNNTKTEFPTNNEVQESENGTKVTPNEEVVTLPEDDLLLTQKQKNSISMLNYLAITAEEIFVSKNNRIMLDEVYSSLISNTNPDKIDETTQGHINNLLDVIKNYRMITIKRERLEYLYNQDKASTIRSAVPNPLSILAVVNSFDWKKLVASVAYTAVDSYNNYKNKNADIDQKFLTDGWELDDKETENIQKNRERAFNYMIDIVREYQLPGELSLSEKAVKEFAQLCSEDNVHQKLQFLESEENTYKTLGNYWLERADCYYEIGNYQNCINCINQYNSLSTGIFRKDYNYAKILPKVIHAAQEIYNGGEYVSILEKYTDDIIKNTENSDWSARYFVAQVYLDLYSRTNDKAYLKKTYDIALNNINHLVDKQIELNETFLNDVVEKTLDATNEDFLSKEEKKQRKAEQKELDKYNKSLKEARKTELPPIYEPLVLNCDLLFSLEEHIVISDAEKEKIKGILRTENNGVFISKPVNDRYSFGAKSKTEDIEFKKDELILPASLLSDNATIKVTLKNKDGQTVYEDWIVDKVKREDKSISTFKTFLSSKKIKDYKWTADTTILIEIFNGTEYPSTKFNYKVKEYKDYFVVPDKIKFEKI